MKLSITLLSVIALASAIPHGLQQRNLQSDLQEFANLFNQDEIQEIVIAYWTCDKEFGAFVQFVKSADFSEFIEGLAALPEFSELRQFFGDLSNQVRSAVRGLESIRSKRSVDDEFDVSNCNREITGGFGGFFHDIFIALPLEEIKALFAEKLQTSPDFQAFIAKLQSDELRSIIQRLRANLEFQRLIFKAKADLEALINHA